MTTTTIAIAQAEKVAADLIAHWAKHPELRTSIYIAGPMTGLPEFNYPAFNAAAQALRTQGITVANPAEHIEPCPDPTWADWMRVALRAMLSCRAVLLLPGWEASKGARIERLLAADLGMPAYDFPRGAPLWMGLDFGDPLGDRTVWVDRIMGQAQEPVKRVYLVATGEEHEGEATYTRHDNAPPPLCDAECLFSHPVPQQTAAGGTATATVAVPIGWLSERYIGTKANGEDMYHREQFSRERPYSTDRNIIPLYPAPQQAAPSGPPSNDEIAQLSLQFVELEPLTDFDYVGFASAVLDRWGNTSAAPTSEQARATLPMTGDENESDLGEWQSGSTKPTQDGTYLREFDEGPGTSEYHQGKWLRDGFFPSDIQDARWRGRAAPASGGEAQEPVKRVALPQGAQEVGSDGWPKLTSRAQTAGGGFSKGLSARLVVEACYRRAEVEASIAAMTPEDKRDTERARRALWEVVNGPLEATTPAQPQTDLTKRLMRAARREALTWADRVAIGQAIGWLQGAAAACADQMPVTVA